MQENFITPRLLLDALNFSDVEFVRVLVNTPGWIEFIGDRKIKTNEDALVYIQKLMSNPNIQYWVVRLKSQNIPVGVITFIKRDYLDSHDIGFAFLPEHSGKGYAIESASAVVEYAKNVIGLKRITAITLEGNDRSINILNKLGMSFKEKIIYPGSGEELLLYSIELTKYDS